MWIAHNFPDERLEISILGCIEEMGELVHAHIKEDQGIRGDAAQHQADARDAIGDLTVYLLGVMNVCGAPRQRAIVKSASSDWCLRMLADAVGRLAVAPSVFYCERIIAHLEHYCEFRKWDYELIVKATWAEVKKRDWIKYPETGLPEQVTA